MTHDKPDKSITNGGTERAKYTYINLGKKATAIVIDTGAGATP